MARERAAGSSFEVWLCTEVAKITIRLQIRGGVITCISLIVGAAIHLAPGRLYDRIWLGKWWLVAPLRSGIELRWLKSQYGCSWGEV